MGRDITGQNRYGKAWRDRPHYGTALQAGTTQGLKALPALIELAQKHSNTSNSACNRIDLASPLMAPELLTFCTTAITG